MAGAIDGDRVDEDDEARQQEYDDEHGHEVEEQKPRHAPKGTDEARKSHEEDDDADDDDWPLEELHAGVIGLHGEPDADADDRYREKHGQKVDAGDDGVIESHCGCRLGSVCCCCWFFSDGGDGRIACGRFFSLFSAELFHSSLGVGDNKVKREPLPLMMRRIYS